MTARPAIVAPPPWALTGNGYLFLGHFPQAFVEKYGFLADYQRAAYDGWIGSVMFVDYHDTPVGPYQELLFIPGFFKLGKQRTFSISKIYVSTYESVWNGIENWAIPKELADFRVERIDSHHDRLLALHNGQPFFDVTIRKGTFSFPMSTALFPLRIMQQQANGQLLLTKPSAKGKAHFGKITNVAINAQHFPDLAQVRPLAVLAVEGFEMKFPVPVGA